MEVFDIENWSRKSQYEFFKDYEDPFFNLDYALELRDESNKCNKIGHFETKT